MPWRASRALAALAALIVSVAGLAGAEEKQDFGNVALWEVSGITGPAESYENQLSLVFSPALKLGRLLRVPDILRPLTVSLELQLQMELAGNDARFRGAQYAGPLIPGGAESISINETGHVSGVDAGQVEGTGRRAVLSDLWLGFAHPTLYKIPWVGVELGGRLSLTFPTSPTSLASGLLSALTFGFDLTRTLFGRWDLGYSLRHTQYFYRYATAEVATLPGEVVINGRPEPIYHPPRGTVLNPSFGFVNELSTGVRIIKGLSLEASYSLVNTFTHALPAVELEGIPLADPCEDGPAVADAVGGSVVRCGDRAQRDSHWFQVHLAYALPWVPALSLRLGLSTLQPVRHEGAAISNPLVQTAPTANYTTLELGVLADLEQTTTALWRALRGAR